MAVETHPRLEDRAPFPTLFWLTCPILAKRAGALEARGFMAALSQRLYRDAGLRRRLERAMERYTARRDAHEVIEDAGSPPGGVPDRIKCLHAHVAQEMADGPNPVGALVLAEAGWPDCVAPCVARTR